MSKKLAFVLSGGGARGALQVGAMKALQKAGFLPDLLIGSSIGAVNSAFLAINGFSKRSLGLLIAAWKDAASSNLLPANYLQLMLRAMFGRSSIDPSQRIRDFFISHGLTPGLRFRDIGRPSLIIVSADLNTGTPVLHGMAPDDEVLEGLLLSTALPPWVMPSRKQGRYLMDGGAVSNLPIEPALKVGATEIIALDLADKRKTVAEENKIGFFLNRLVFTVEKRQADLEMELAEARGTPINSIHLISKDAVPFWDFRSTEELIAQGYQIALQAINKFPCRLLQPIQMGT